MTDFFGDLSEDQTLYIPFNTFSSDDPSASVTISNLADADIKVHKDGSATEITTDGATIAIDFDSITGNHLITIDTSADAAYSTGSDYLVRIEGTTIDGATINAWVGSFSIENRYMRGTNSAATASALATVDTVVDGIQTDLSNGTDGLGAIKADTAATLVDTGTTIPGTITTAQGNITDILADTNELQADWVNGGRLDLIIDATLVDTAEIGTAGAGLTNINLPDQTMNITGSLSGTVGSVSGDTKQTADHTASIASILQDTATTIPASIADVPTVAEFNARTPSAAELAYIVANANTGLPVTFTTSGGATTTAVINQIDGAAGSSTDDQYNGRLLVFTDGTLKGVVTDITDYVGSSTTATITAIPTAPTASHTARLI